MKVRALPWFVDQQNVDKMILVGSLDPQLNVMCRGCGAWGKYIVWVRVPDGDGSTNKMCPQCGGTDTERVGELE